jgi:tetratricopeptide (TPR) repeat protein
MTGNGNVNAPEIPVTMSLPFEQVLALAEQHLEARRLSAAETLCQDILRARPDCAPALHLLGIIAYQAGNLPAAIDLVRRATMADGSVALYHCNLGEMCRLAGQTEAALGAGRRALAIDPNLPQANNNVGIVHYERGEFDDAIVHYRRAVALAPHYAEAHSNLGNALRAQKKYEEALVAYRQARQLRPDYADAISNMGTALREMGHAAEAESTYRHALTLKPDDAGILNNLALVLKDAEQFDEAIALLNRSLAANPNNAQTVTYIALVRLEQKLLPDAEIAAQRALALAPDDPEAINAVGLVRFEQQKPDEALSYFHRALALKPGLADTHNNIGNILKEDGQLAAARQEYARAVELDPRETAFYFNLADSKKFVAGDAHLASMEQLAQNAATLSVTARCRLNFALAKAYDDLGRTDDAFRCMREGNEQKRRRIDYDEARTFAYFDRIRSSFDRNSMGARLDYDHSSLPVFIVGMPRSGTTLIEQILASHPDVYGAGELVDFSRLVDRMRDDAGNSLRYPEDMHALTTLQFRELGKAYVGGLQAMAPNAKRVTDKMPGNHVFLGLIHLALPDARIIHVRREPRDTCLSCYSKLFSAPQDFTYDLGELGRYYRKYEELMAHWRDVLPPGRVLDVRYEDVITDVETWARRIVGHCGLDWNPACVAFHEARRPVRTASASQVRRPVYRTSEGRWRAYGNHLGPLLAVLGDA